jgi:hypothetical protein
LLFFYKNVFYTGFKCANGTRIECLPGSYQNQSRQSECVLCTEGTFASTASLDKCSVCAPGKFSLAGESECSLCPLGYFIFIYNVDIYA